eukprot:4717510-Prymnesium_polylepis.1
MRRSFAEAIAREHERGHTGSEAHRSAEHLLQQLNSVLAKQQHHMITTPGTRNRQSGATRRRATNRALGPCTPHSATARAMLH